MGWSSANEIFDPVVQAMVEAAVGTAATTRVLTVLIKALQDGDWDTEDESLELFKDYPAVVEAFRRNGVPGSDDYDQEEGD
jgi:hypothetical protein